MSGWNNKQANAVAAIRVSSIKQGLQGDSPEAQREQIEQFARNHNINLQKVFVFIESASKENQPVQEAIDYCKNPKNDVQLFIIKSIDRFTRGGSYLYDHLKMQLTQYGVRLVDIYGVISDREVNTLEHLGMEYKWSVYSPTKKSEILEAERAKDEIRDILSRMIGAEIRYTRLGYRCGIAPYGYINEKAETQHGKRVILKPHPEESKWVIRMFELRIRGDLTDRQIVEEVNNIGYISRKYYRRGKNDKTQVVGIKGQGKLSLKQLWRYIENPVYAGIAIHKWTDNKPVKGQFEGLVTIDQFNRANREKNMICEEKRELKYYKDIPPDWQLKKTVRNPDFPYRRYVMCPECENPLFGSSSKGKLGKYYPAYHCNKRGHYFRVPVKKFEDTIHNFVKGLKITPEYTQRLKDDAIAEWKRRMSETQNDKSEIDAQITELSASKASITQKIRILSSETVLKSLETDLLKIEKEIHDLEEEKEKKESDYINMEIVLDKVENLLEHLEDLLLGSPDPLKRAAYFGVIFQKAPTYQELLSATPQLEPIVSLNYKFQRSGNLSVDDEGLEPPTSSV